jgi:4-amino-4-deoxy-L-arabinose transferase-like glycosyltransferase
MTFEKEVGHSRRTTAPLASLGLFLAALLPRAAGLGSFGTADEAKWVYRSAQFLGALLRGDLAGTVVNLTPGVTTTWLGASGLAAYYALHRAELAIPFTAWLASLPEFRADLGVLVAVRWPMVLLTSLGVVAFYHLAHRLVAGPAALLAALLLAFDPHFISLSRVLGHDAPAGVFVGLALLAFLLPLTSSGPTGKPVGWRWTIASGALAGLAWLSKSPAFFLAPFVGLVALVEALRQRTALVGWLLRLAMWGIAGLVVFALVWPVGWRDPLGAPYAVVHNAFLSATDSAEAEAEGYWQVPDLGLLYYVINGALKLSPLVTLGLAAWVGLLLARRRKATAVEWWLLLFAVSFTAFMTWGSKHSNRYILPAWPALCLLAAVGLEQIANRQIGKSAVSSQQSAVEAQIVDHRPPTADRESLPSDLQPSTFNLQSLISNLQSPSALRNTQYAILIIFLLLPALLTYPYYSTYFNPLLGGPLVAPRLVKIGWGEGLDQVGGWLSSQPDAPALKVGSYYASALAPFFSGQISDVTSGGLDYVVLYRKQAQGGYPAPTILRYFAAEEPLYTVRLAGIDYAWIYPGPAVQPALANEAAFDIGILPKPLAFRLAQPALPIGQAATVEVLWLAGDDLPVDPSRLTLQPVGDLARQRGEGNSQVFAESPARLERRRPDGLIVSRHTLSLPAGLPRGTYGLLVDGRPLGEVDARRAALPPLDVRLDADFGGQVRLAGYAFDSAAARLRLVWQAAPHAAADYTVFVHVVDAAGQRVAGADAQPPVPASQWGRGEVIVDEHSLPLAGLPAGEYHLVVGLYRPDTGARLPVADSGDALTLPTPINVK